MNRHLLFIGWIIAASFLAMDRTYAAELELERPSRQEPRDLRHSGSSGTSTNDLQGFAPQSHVPPRSPDLGIPTHPLSPSTSGPGRGLLGLEAGRTPAPAQPRDSERSSERQKR